MQPNIHPDSSGALRVLERDDAEECRSSEATWLPVTWRSMHAWRLPLRRRARNAAARRFPNNDRPPRRVRAESLVMLARQYIEDHYPENVSLEHVADALGADAFHLSRLVKKAAGMDFSDYLVSVRIEKAKDLLLNPNYYFTEIVSELGFESLGQFNQAFKKFVGEPPHAYRARLPIMLRCVEREA